MKRECGERILSGHSIRSCPRNCRPQAKCDFSPNLREKGVATGIQIPGRPNNSRSSGEPGDLPAHTLRLLIGRGVPAAASMLSAVRRISRRFRFPASNGEANGKSISLGRRARSSRGGREKFPADPSAKASTPGADSAKAARAAIEVTIDPARDALLTNFGRATLEDRYLLAGRNHAGPVRARGARLCRRRARTRSGSTTTCRGCGSCRRRPSSRTAAPSAACRSPVS